uniref:Uncharacterized protein n=1 Tax=Rhizophora mucronata TaxID=61149 RepID=A0A2P2QN51_RHIMU
MSFSLGAFISQSDLCFSFHLMTFSFLHFFGRFMTHICY